MAPWVKAPKYLKTYGLENVTQASDLKHTRSALIMFIFHCFTEP